MPFIGPNRKPNIKNESFRAVWRNLEKTEFWGRGRLQKSPWEGVLFSSDFEPELAGNCPDGGKLRLASILRMLRIPKSVGSGTFRALYGGLRGQNRKLADRCKGQKISKIENFSKKNLKNRFFWKCQKWLLGVPKCQMSKFEIFFRFSKCFAP